MGCFGKTERLFVVPIPVGTSNSKTNNSIQPLSLTKVDESTHDHGADNKPSDFGGIPCPPGCECFKHVVFPSHSKSIDPMVELQSCYHE